MQILQFHTVQTQSRLIAQSRGAMKHLSTLEGRIYMNYEFGKDKLHKDLTEHFN